MKRVNVILDETTIINFPFIGRMIKRYYLISILTPILVVLAASFIYFSQKDLYLTETGFSYVSSTGGSGGTGGSLGALLGGNESSVSSAEIIQSARSITMYQKLAEKLYLHPHFKDLNYNKIGAKEPQIFSRLFSGCGENKACFINKLRGYLPALYSVKVNSTISTKYNLHVKSLDFQTTKILKETIPQVLRAYRLKIIKDSLLEQMRISEELILKKQKELTEGELSKVVILVQRNDEELKDINLKLALSFSAFNSAKSKLEQAKIYFNETEKTIKKRVSGKALARSKRIRFLKNEIQEIRENISSMLAIADGPSSPEIEITKELKRELRRKRRELKKIDIKRGRSVTSMDRFLESKDITSSGNEFNYTVARKQFEGIEINHHELLEKKSLIMTRREGLLKDQEKTLPSFEILKVLQAKLMQLKLIESTTISDLVFDDISPGINKVKTKTKEKMILFSFAISLFLTLFLIITRYLLDVRIYDEYELKMNFEDLEIIGNTPDFD